MAVTAVIRIACALLIAAAACGLAACGGDDGADDRAAIADTLRTGLMSTDPAVLCGETLSTGLQQRVYGVGERCTAVETQSAASRVAPTGVTVTQVHADGDKGTAVVALKGNGQDTVRGAVSLVRQDGRWLLDDLSTAFLRSSLNAGLAGDHTIDEALVGCLGAKLRGLDDAALRALALGAMGGRPLAQAQLRRFVVACVGALGVPAVGDTA